MLITLFEWFETMMRKGNKVLKYIGFRELLINYNSLTDGMICSVEKQEDDLLNAIFYIVDYNETKEYIEGNFGTIPKEIYNDEDIIWELIETKIFKNIVNLKLKNNEKLDINENTKDFLDAFEFYLEFNAYKDEV